MHKTIRIQVIYKKKGECPTIICSRVQRCIRTEVVNVRS